MEDEIVFRKISKIESKFFENFIIASLKKAGLLFIKEKMKRLQFLQFDIAT